MDAVQCGCMNTPTIFVVADTEDAGNWLPAIRAIAGSTVDARSVQSLSAVPLDASVALVDWSGAGSGTLSFSPHPGPATVLALGALTGIPAGSVDAFGGGFPPHMIGSILPLWHTDWYRSLRKALAGGRLGALRRISLVCGHASGASAADQHSPVCRAVMLPTGLGPDVVIEWSAAGLSPDGFEGEGWISGTGTAVSLRPGGPGAPVTAEIEGSRGRASVEFDQDSASVVISTMDDDDCPCFKGRFIPMAGAARQVVQSALAGRPGMMPGSSGNAFRRSIDGLVRACGMASSSARSRGGFEPNSFRGGFDGKAEIKVFVEGRCNMACPFCFSPTVQPAAGTVDGFLAQFVELKKRDVATVILSGGEPALNPHLAEIVRAAGEAGIDDVTLETNAVLVNQSLAADLAAAGLRRALVSLHSVAPEVSDAMTGTRGQLPRTMAGLSFLLKAGIPVIVNFVITSLNWHDLPATAAWVSSLDPAPEMMVISSMAVTGAAASRPDLLARFADAAPAIREAVRILRDAGVTPVIPGQCGLAPCILPDMPGLFSTGVSMVRDADWIAGSMEGRFHAPGCESCRMRKGCYGIWGAYAERFGTDEFKPLL